MLMLKIMATVNADWMMTQLGFELGARTTWYTLPPTIPISMAKAQHTTANGSVSRIVCLTTQAQTEQEVDGAEEKEDSVRQLPKMHATGLWQHKRLCAAVLHESSHRGV